MKVIDEVNIDNKRVILRCDFNVPMSNGEILDDTKISRSLNTINYLISHNCQILIMSHFGKVKKEEDLKNNSLEKVAIRLAELLEKPVKFSKKASGLELTLEVNSLKPGEVLLMENTRFLDLPDKLESGNDLELAEYWSNFGDIFVNDAFASSHRLHASTNGIAKFLPTYIGFLFQEEIYNLDNYITDPKKPLTVIMGGAKVDDKLDLIEAMLKKCDHLILGGGLANTCLKTLGFEVGESLVTTDPKVIERLKGILFQYKEKIVLPLDVIVGSTYNEDYVEYKLVNDVSVDDVILDIGTKTLQKIEGIVNSSETIFVNGTVGKYEDYKFCNGSKELLNILKKSNKIVVVGGGDAVSAVNKLGFNGAFTYVSSGGGATLEYLTSNKINAFEGIKVGE